MKHGIKYSNCWEDAYLLQEALQVNEQSSVLSIASAGDNSLFLCSFQPAAMHCIDTNKEQLYLTQLKEQSIKHLDYENFLALLGFGLSPDRFKIYDTIKNYLPIDAQHYFEKHKNLIEEGIIHQGKFEKYFQLFAKRILPLIHNKKRIALFVQIKTAEDQKEFFEKKWKNWRWRLLFRIFFSKTLMSLLGRDKEKFEHVEQSIGQRILKRTETHFKSTAVFENYLLDYCLYGFFKSMMPPYAQAQNFQCTKKWLQVNEIKYSASSFADCIKLSGDANCFNLSNIFEYVSANDFEKQIVDMTNKLQPNARLLYWELFNERNMPESKFTLTKIDKTDYGFFYEGSKFYIRK